MTRLLAGSGIAVLLTTFIVIAPTSSASAQSYCAQVRQAVATYGYAAARRHALAHYGAKAVARGDQCLRGGHHVGRAQVRRTRHHR
jgi:hypothetical protein